jgi:isoamylase
LRRRQAKNFLAILLLSHDVPMILADDELLRTQKGNNNAWCQDNELGWFDWTLPDRNAEMLRFAREMIAFRMYHACLRRRRFVTVKPSDSQSLPDVTWHGWRLNEPPWDDPEAWLPADTLADVCEGQAHVYIVLNMQDEPE